MHSSNDSTNFHDNGANDRESPEASNADNLQFAVLCNPNAFNHPNLLCDGAHVKIEVLDVQRWWWRWCN